MDLRELAGLSLGPGPWLEIDQLHLERFWKALDYPGEGAQVPLLYLLSLLPALSSGQNLPVPAPRATINYGLNWFAGGEPCQSGDLVRATTTVSGAEWLGGPGRSPLQIIRRAGIENDRSELVLSAETVSRLIF
ncbi:MAG TPA: hypothetical protein VJ935_04920 [Acidimicrobiia bacterium]|nr:hypothetical protein [Acidimicrobiia bacterium]